MKLLFLEKMLYDNWFMKHFEIFKMKFVTLNWGVRVGFYDCI